MEATLRILHIDPERQWGGGEEQVLGLARHLKNMGHAVGVAAHPGGPLWRAVTAAGVEARPLVVRNTFDLKAASALRQLATGADVVHFHTARAHALALWLGRKTARRVVTRRMDYRPGPRPYVRLLYNRCVDKVVAISRAIRDVLVTAGVGPDRISVIRSGVEVARFVSAAKMRAEARRQEWGAGLTEPVVVVVGALVRRKGHEVLLEAARLLASRGFRVRYGFCGDGEYREGLQRHVEDLGLGEFVRFMGWRNDVARVLAGADVAVVPSLKEGLGVAALEAMAAALPVIASRIGGLAEVVWEGETGWLVPPGDPAMLAQALEHAIRDPALARRYGLAGQDRARTEFTMERMAAKNEELYRELTGCAA